VVPHFAMQTKILPSQKIMINPIWNQRVFLKNYTRCFEKIFVVIAHVFGVTCFLIMTKPSNRVHPIVVREIFYRLRLQFHDTFATHFSLHQFKIATKAGCEMVIHGFKCTMTKLFSS
jgi:hypothetical protein